MQLFSFDQGVPCQAYDAAATNNPVHFSSAAVYGFTVLAAHGIDQTSSSEMQEDAAPTPNTSVQSQPTPAESNRAHDDSNLVVSNPTLPQNHAPFSADANQFGNQGWPATVPIDFNVTSGTMVQSRRSTGPAPVDLSNTPAASGKALDSYLNAPAPTIGSVPALNQPQLEYYEASEAPMNGSDVYGSSSANNFNLEPCLHAPAPSDHSIPAPYQAQLEYYETPVASVSESNVSGPSPTNHFGLECPSSHQSCHWSHSTLNQLEYCEASEAPVNGSDVQ